MATLKISTLNLNGQLTDGNVFRVKLDAWKQTFYVWGENAQNDVIRIDGFNLTDLAHDRYLNLPGSDNYAGNGPLVLEFGGASYKGRPIMLDDELTFTCGKLSEASNCRLLCVKQYFVEDRPGPDRTLAEQVKREIVAPRQIAPRVPGTRPRITSVRPVRRNPLDR
jgi:hypothetical protein